MNWSVLPPAVAAFVAVVLSVSRRIATVLLELSVIIPSPRMLTTYVAGGRFVSFVLVYGLLLGISFWVGTRRGETTRGGTLAVVTGAVAAFSYLVGTGAVFAMAGSQQDVLVNGLVMLGSSFGVGVQLATVTFAGLAAATRR